MAQTLRMNKCVHVLLSFAVGEGHSPLQCLELKVGEKGGGDYYLFGRIIPSRAIIWMGENHVLGVIDSACMNSRRAWHSHHGWQTMRGAATGQGSGEHDLRGVFSLGLGEHASNIPLMAGMLPNYKSRLVAAWWRTI